MSGFKFRICTARWSGIIYCIFGSLSSIYRYYMCYIVKKTSQVYLSMSSYHVSFEFKVFVFYVYREFVSFAFSNLRMGKFYAAKQAYSVKLLNINDQAYIYWMNLFFFIILVPLFLCASNTICRCIHTPAVCV